MLKIIEEDHGNVMNVVPMSEMKPLQVGIIVDKRYPDYKYHYVMRTASYTKFEVMDLTKPCRDGCWCMSNAVIKVRLLNPGVSITVKLSN